MKRDFSHARHLVLTIVSRLKNILCLCKLRTKSELKMINSREIKAFDNAERRILTTRLREFYIMLFISAFQFNLKNLNIFDMINVNKLKRLVSFDIVS